MSDLLGTEDLDANRRFDAARPSSSSAGGGNGSSTRTGAGAMLRLIRDGRASTRAELIPAGASASTGGRPPKTFAFNRNAGVVLAADLGATHSRVAVTDLAGDVMVETRTDIPIADGPDTVLGWLEETFDVPAVDRTITLTQGKGTAAK